MGLPERVALFLKGEKMAKVTKAKKPTYTAAQKATLAKAKVSANKAHISTKTSGALARNHAQQTVARTTQQYSKMVNTPKKATTTKTTTKSAPKTVAKTSTAKSTPTPKTGNSALLNNLNYMATRTTNAQAANEVSRAAAQDAMNFAQQSANNANLAAYTMQKDQQVYNAQQAQQANQFSADMWQKQADFNAQQQKLAQEYNTNERLAAQEYNTKMVNEERAWQEKMASQSIQMRMKDLEAAGLNPILAYAQGGANVGGGAAIGTHAQSVSPASVGSISGQAGTSGLAGTHSASGSSFTGQLDNASWQLALLGAAAGGISDAIKALADFKSNENGEAQEFVQEFIKNPVKQGKHKINKTIDKLFGTHKSYKSNANAGGGSAW